MAILRNTRIIVKRITMLHILIILIIIIYILLYIAVGPTLGYTIAFSNENSFHFSLPTFHINNLTSKRMEKTSWELILLFRTKSLSLNMNLSPSATLCSNVHNNRRTMSVERFHPTRFLNISEKVDTLLRHALRKSSRAIDTAKFTSRMNAKTKSKQMENYSPENRVSTCISKKFFLVMLHLLPWRLSDSCPNNTKRANKDTTMNILA